MKYTYLLLLTIFITLSGNLYATKTTTINNGDWSNTNTWNNGVPGVFDTIVINDNITISKNITIGGTPTYIIINGSLYINCKNNLRGYRLKLPSGSAILLEINSNINGCNSATIGGRIIIGSTIVYNANNNQVNGPTYLAESGTSLPVELLYLKSYIYNDNVLIEWETASEIDNDYFLILRSNDLNTWDTIHKIKGAGNANYINHYQVLDDINFGDNYYMLVQVDFNGAQKVFDIIYQFISQNTDDNNIIVFPNPTVDNNIMVVRSFNEKAMLTVYDNIGKLILMKPLEQGQTEIKLNLNITKGLYIIVIRTKENIFTKHLIRTN